MMTYDPAFMNTAACKSRITYIDGDKGILLYRGYPIEQLAEHSDFLETAYLILFGELPDAAQYDAVDASDHAAHDAPHEHRQADGGLPPRCPPDGHVHQHDGRAVDLLSGRQEHLLRGVAPAADGAADREGAEHLRLRVPALDRPAVQPARQRAELCRQLPEHAVPDDRAEVQARTRSLERALDVLFILHADHEQNCSTASCAAIGSSHADPYSAIAGAAAALYGPLHGGANEAVLRMLHEIGSIQNVPAFIKRVKAGEGRLMGFGHRVYKSYDPRAKIIKRIADLVFEVTGKNPLLDMALELERIALEDEYFVIAQALSERGLLFRADLPGDGLPGRHVPGAVRDPAHRGLDRAVGGDAHRSGSEDCAAAPDLRRPDHARLRREGQAPMTRSQPRPPWRIGRAGARRAARPRSARGPPATPKFDGGRAFEDLRQMVAIGPRPAGSPALDRTRAYIKKQLEAAGLTVQEQPFDAQTPLGPDPHDQPARDAAGRRAGPRAPGDRRPLRHEALSRVSVRRRERRRIQRGVPARTRPRAQGAEEPHPHRAAVSRRRGGSRRLAGHGPHLRQPLLRRGGAPRPARVKDIRAFILVDMIGDRELGIRREQHSTPWLTDAIWSAARRLKRPEFLEETTPIEDDHQEFLAAGVPSVDVIDLEYPAWHRSEDRLDHVCGRQPAGRRGRPRGRPAGDRSAPEVAATPASISARDLALAQHGRGPLRAAEDPIHQRLAGWNAAPLEPEQHVRFARHRSDVDLLLAADQAGGHRRIHRVDELAIAAS